MITILICSITLILIFAGIIYQLYIVSENLEEAGVKLKSKDLSSAGRNLLYVAVFLFTSLLVYFFFIGIYIDFIKNILNNL